MGEGAADRAIALAHDLPDGYWVRAMIRAALERLIARNADDSAYQIAEVYAWQGQTPAWRSTAPAPWSSSSRRR